LIEQAWDGAGVGLKNEIEQVVGECSRTEGAVNKQSGNAAVLRLFLNGDKGGNGRQTGYKKKKECF